MITPRSRHRALLVHAFTLAAICLPPSLQAVTYKWNSAAGGTWGTTTNWSPTGNPSAADTVDTPLLFGELRLKAARTLGTLTYDSGSNWNIVGRDSGTAATSGLTVTGDLNKSGAGTLTFSRGGVAGEVTTVSLNTITVTGGGLTFTNLNGLTLGGTTTINAGTTLTLGTPATVNGLIVNGTLTGGAVLDPSGDGISGAGTITNKVVLNTNDVISPKSSPGPGTLTLTKTGADSVVFGGGGTYLFEMNNATGVAGAASGWDKLAISGTLKVDATPANPFVIQLTSLTSANAPGNAQNFNLSSPYTWTIATVGGIAYGSGASLASFVVDSDDFSNAIRRDFKVTYVAGTLQLTYTPHDLNLAGGRYQDKVFPLSQVHKLYDDDVYAPNVLFVHTSQPNDPRIGSPLYLDFWEPMDDTETHRPLVIWTHGGGFLTGTEEIVFDETSLMAEYTRRGYAVASIRYRMTAREIFGVPVVESQIAAAYVAAADLLSAVRYFRMMAATDPNRYRIDPNRIILSGGSAGGITSLTAGISSEYAATLGANKGNTEHSSYPSWVSSVATTAGAIFEESYRLAHIDPADPVHFEDVHGTNDNTVPISLAQDTSDDINALGAPTSTMDLTRAEGAGHQVSSNPNYPFTWIADELVPDIYTRVVTGNPMPAPSQNVPQIPW